MLDAGQAGALRYEIINRGYAELEHGIPQEYFDSLIYAYCVFTTEHPDPEFATMNAMLGPTPADLRSSSWLDELDYSKDKQTKWHKYRTSAPHPGKPNGYTSRAFLEACLMAERGIDIKEDPKEYYHYTRGHYSAILKHHEKFEWGPIPPEVITLNERFRPIHQKASSLILRVCATIEDEHPGIRQLITPGSLKNSPIRLLGYHHTDKPYLGEDHYDKSLITLQLGESHEGLMVAPNSESPLVLVKRDSTKTAMFMGRTLSDPDPEVGYYPNSPYRPGWHGIANLQSPNEGQGPIPDIAEDLIKRWALIFFAGAVKFKTLSKKDTHIRMQEAA